MSNGNWLKLNRELMEKPIWLNSTPEQKVILITLLAMVNHAERQWEWQGKQFMCQPGQTVTSIESIKEKCGKGISTQNVRTALVRFEKLEFLTNESTKTGRLITIVNWAKYQDSDYEPNIEPNKDLTKTSQRPNKDLTTNKNDKELKNKEKIYKKESGFSPPTIDDVRQYCMERKNGIDAETFVAFYESKGWMIGKNKMKDWKAAVRTWERKRREEMVADKPPVDMEKKKKNEEELQKAIKPPELTDEEKAKVESIKKQFGIDKL